MSNFFSPADGYDKLEDIRENRVKMGLGIGIHLSDQHLIFKKGQFVIITGHDNVGKTAWVLWYYCVLSIKYGLTWDIYSAENSLTSLQRDIMSFLSGKQLNRMSEKELARSFETMNQYFKFIRNDEQYTATELLKIAATTKSDGLLIDPFNALVSVGGNKHEADYATCGEIRIFCHKTKKSVYVNTHLVTEAARKVYPKDHDLAGHLMPPNKSDIEGGQKFANRCDDFICLHRLTQHDTRKTFTEVHVRKVKDTITGGSVTLLDRPLIFKMWDYSRFECGEQNPLAMPSLTENTNLLKSFANESNFEF